MIRNAIVAIDFDETITDNTPYPVMGNVRPGCKEAIDFIRQHNKVILWTCREGYFLEEALGLLKREGIEVDAVNKDIREVGRTKVYANIYIDDRNIFAEEVDWYKIKHYFETEEKTFTHIL